MPLKPEIAGGGLNEYQLHAVGRGKAAPLMRALASLVLASSKVLL
jgi:hypothetical protein